MPDTNCARFLLLGDLSSFPLIIAILQPYCFLSRMVHVLLLRVDLLIHLRKPVLDNFYDPFGLFGRGNIEF